MKIERVLVFVALASLLITAGCISNEKNQNTVPSNDSTQLPVVSNQSPVVSATITLQANYIDKLIGAWKTETNGSQAIYWQFNNNGTLTGGSEPGSHDITGRWGLIGLRNLFEMNATGTNSTGKQTTYDIVIYYDLASKNVYVVNPPEDRNWNFIRQ